MTLDTQTMMMLFFIFLVAISFYKIRQFLPQEQLADDDTTPEATQELERIILKVIHTNKKELTLDTLFHLVKEDEDFNPQHFWRFNQNRLRHLLEDLKLQGKLK